MIFDVAGNLYGTTVGGGRYNWGTVFELSPQAGGGWTQKVLHDFNPKGGDGGSPYARLIFDGVGHLYGTTVNGGDITNCEGAGCGTVFELTPNEGGVWTEKVLHSFSNNGEDGVNPFGNLIFDAAGNLYGTTYDGGAARTVFGLGWGTVFELMPQADGGWMETILHSFNPNHGGFNPMDGLIFDAAGNLYGTTSAGGAHGGGTVFEITP